MLPVFVVKVAEIIVGVAIGNVASDALDKGIDVAKKVVEDVKAKKAESQK